MALTPVDVLNLVPTGDLEGTLTGPYYTRLVEVYVYLPPNITGGSQCRFFWGTQAISRSIGPTTNYLQFTINEAFVPSQALSDGTHPVYYVIQDFLGNTTTSPVVQVTILNSQLTSPTLAPITFTTALFRGYIINIAIAAAPIVLSIPAYTDQAVGDKWTLFLRLIRPDGTQARVETVDTNTVETLGAIPVTIPANSSLFTGLDGVNGFFYYAVDKPTGQDLISNNVQVVIDTVAPGA